MDPDRPLKAPRGQALLELVLLAPLFLALVLSTLYLVRALNARLALIQTCRDTALSLARDTDDRDLAQILKTLLHERGLESLGHWEARLEGALPGDTGGASSPIGELFGALVAERLILTLDLPTPRWMPGGPWHFKEQVTFKRNPWKASLAQALKFLRK